MDPLTHAISGAVAGRALVPDADATAGRVARAALFLGAVFPDSDVLLNPFEPNGLGTIRFHRGVTHSLVCLPLFAALFAAGLGWFCRRRWMECPSWLRLSVLLGAGMGMHIGLDLITSFGTMMWSPLNWSRVSWDTTFIIDPILTSILLLPLLLGWVYRGREKAEWRGALLWSGMSLVAMGVVWAWKIFERMAASPDSGPYDFALELLPSISIAGVVSGILACALGLPAMRGRGFRVARRTWCRAGVAFAAAYLLMSAGAHAVALRRVEAYARTRGLQVQNIGALPMPPSLLFWSGLIRTPNQLHYAYFSLLDREPPAFRTFDQPPPDSRIEEALELPDVQIVLRFFRFPLIVHEEPSGSYTGSTDVNFYDLRFFPQLGNTLPFSYRITFDAATGRILYRGRAGPHQ